MKTIIFISLFLFSFFSNTYSDKYQELMALIKERETENKFFFENDSKNKGLFYRSKIISFENVPDKEGRTTKNSSKKLKGAYKNTDKTPCAIHIINDKTFKTDSVIVADICIKSWVKGKKTKHFRTWRYEYSKDEGDWYFWDYPEKHIIFSNDKFYLRIDKPKKRSISEMIGTR